MVLSGDILEKKEDEKKKISDKVMLIAIGVLVILFFSIFIIKIFFKEPEPKTLDELHLANLQRELNDEQGYIYNGYSFVNIDNFWYTQLKSSSGRILYNLNFRYGPKDVEDIQIRDNLDNAFFNNAKEYYVTFNPVGFGGDFTYVTLAVADFNENMIKVYKKKPIAACDRNETDACKARPIIDCNSDAVVFYIQESETTEVVLDENCIIVKGQGFNLVKAVDRLLFFFYRIQ